MPWYVEAYKEESVNTLGLVVTKLISFAAENGRSGAEDHLTAPIGASKSPLRGGLFVGSSSSRRCWLPIMLEAKSKSEGLDIGCSGVLF